MDRIIEATRQDPADAIGGDAMGVRACEEDPSGESCARWRALAGTVLGMAEREPGDPYVQGQAVLALVRGGAYDVALLVVDGCRAADWWCRVLEGYALAEVDRIAESEVAFDDALRLMPEHERCAWTDLEGLLSADVRAGWEGASTCLEGLEPLDVMWTLVDPAWSVPGLERKVEHYRRVAWAALHDDQLTVNAGEGRVVDGAGHSRRHHAVVLRTGATDAVRGERWRGRGGAPAYHVLPSDRALLDPLHATADDWDVGVARGDGLRPSYQPPWGSMADLEAQVAFFDRGDTLAVAGAVGTGPDAFSGAFAEALGDPPTDGARLFLLGPDDRRPLEVTGRQLGGRRVFRATVPAGRYVVGVEAAAEGGVARLRYGHGLPHDRRAPLRLSDLLLYVPDGAPPPDSLSDAIPLMHGSHRWTRDHPIGVFLEVYGPADSRSYPVSVELEREGGWLARLGEALGIGGQPPLNVRWSEAGDGSRFPLSFTIEPRDLPEGHYTLRVSVGAPGASPAVVERRFRIVDGQEGRSL